MENNEKIKKILKDAKSVIVITENGTGIIGKNVKILSLYSILTKILFEQINGIDKDDLELAFKTAFESEKDLEKKILKQIEEIFENINKKL